jgi:TatD-related deoxyribonuclease
MPSPSDLPIVDHHCHLSPNGEGVAAARRFRAAGGTHLFLCTQSYGPAPPRTLDGYREQFEITSQLGAKVRSETGVVVYIVLAPFPVDLVAHVAELGTVAAESLHTGALELAGRWVRERRAVALGEVGRPHFEVDRGTAEVAAAVFRHSLQVAKEVGCPVVVHSEELDATGFAALAEVARSEGFPPHRVVKHYARSAVAAADRQGVGASYLARRETVDAVLGQAGPWFLETDFLDDPRRPGAVLDLATVPRRATAIARRGPSEEARLWTPFVESVETTYGFAPNAAEAGRP